MIENLPTYVWVVGGAASAAGLRFFWPVLKSAFGAQTGQWRTESGFITQMSDELDRALTRAEAADARAEKALARAEESDRRAEKYFGELSETKTQVQLLTMQLKIANEKIDTLTNKFDEAIGAGHARDSSRV